MPGTANHIHTLIILEWMINNWYNMTQDRTLPDVVWVLGLQVPHQRPHWGLELESSGWWPLQVDLGWVAFREQLFDEAVVGLVHGLRQVAVQQVIVLVHKALDTVQHLGAKRGKTIMKILSVFKKFQCDTDFHILLVQPMSQFSERQTESCKWKPCMPGGSKLQCEVTVWKLNFNIQASCNVMSAPRTLMLTKTAGLWCFISKGFQRDNRGKRSKSQAFSGRSGSRCRSGNSLIFHLYKPNELMGPYFGGIGHPSLLFRLYFTLMYSIFPLLDLFSDLVTSIWDHGV